MNDNEENLTNFKNSLYDKFQSSNILSDLKSKMRHDLLQNLISETNEDKIEKKVPTNPNFFHLKIINNLIIDYLKKQNHNYTYSIFLTEAKLIENNLSNEELDHYFKENCSIWNSKDFQQINNEALIEKILYLLFDKKNKKTFVNHSCQTEEPDKQSLHGLMDNIEQNFESKLGKIARRTTENQEEAFTKYKKIVEDKYQAMLKDEVERIRNFEIEKMKYEENQKFLAKVNEIQKESERNNLERLRRISEREENALKLCKAKIEEIDRKNYENRQQLLLEMDKLKHKEKELEKKYSFEKTNIEGKEKELKDTEKELRTNIEEYERARLILEEKIKENLAERKKISDKNQIKTENILKVQNELQYEKEGSRRFKESIKILETETTYLRKENESLTKENKDLSRIKNDLYEQIEELRTTINSLRERIEFMMNELSAKEEYIKKTNERVEYQDKQLEELKKNLELKRNEIVDIYRNYQTDVEKYQALLQDKQKTLHTNIISTQNIQKPENIDLRKAKIKKLLEETEIEVASPIKEKKTWSKKYDDKIVEDFNDLKKKFQKVIESTNDVDKENFRNYSNLSRNYHNLDGLAITQTNFIEESIPLTKSQKNEDYFAKNDSYTKNENQNKKSNFNNISNNLEKSKFSQEFINPKKENITIEHSKIPSSSKFEKSLDRCASEIKKDTLELPLFSDSNKSEDFKTPKVLSPQTKIMENEINNNTLDCRKSNSINSKHSIKEIPKEKMESSKFLEDEIIKNNHKKNKSNDNYYNSFEKEKKLETTQNNQKDHSNEKKRNKSLDNNKSKDSFNERDNIQNIPKNNKQIFEINPIDFSNKKLDFSPISGPFSNEKNNIDNIFQKNTNLSSMNSLPALTSKLNDSQKNGKESLFEEKINKTMELEPTKKELNFFKKKLTQLDDSDKKNNFEESNKKSSDGANMKNLISADLNKKNESNKNINDSNKNFPFKNDSNINLNKKTSDEKLSLNLPEIKRSNKLPELEKKNDNLKKEEKKDDFNFLNKKNEEKKQENKNTFKNELDDFDDLLNDLDFGNFSDKKTVNNGNNNKSKNNLPEKKIERKVERAKDQEELDFEILEEIEEQGFI